MYGAIIGDIVGSKYEFNNIKTKEFPFLSDGCGFTDDSIMTVAVARALLRSLKEDGDFQPILVEEMQELGRRFPHPQGGYGLRFGRWLDSHSPMPYNSYGNGSAMRCAPCGLIAVTLEEALDLAEASAAVTHDHPEGILGAQATAAAVFLAKTGADKDTIRAYTEQHFYPLDFTLDEIRAAYRFDVSCQGSVPQAIEAFLESESFEDAIRGIISIGGDSDTLGAITGSIAWSYYRHPDRDDGACEKLLTDYRIAEMLPEDFVEVISNFEKLCRERFAAYQQTGSCSSIRLR